MSEQNLGMIVSKSANPTDAIQAAAKWFARSGMFGCDREEQGAILALTCMTENISPVEFSRTYDIVEGKLRKKAMAAFADFRRKGGKVEWLQTGDDGKLVSAKFSFEGQTVLLSYSIEQAKLAGLVKDRGGWVRNPGNMLRARLISNALGMLAPEIYAGEYDDDRTEPAPKTIQLDPPSVEPKKAEATKIVDVPSEVVTAPTPPAAQPVTVATSEVTTMPELPNETQEKLAELIPMALMPSALTFARKQGWIDDMHGIEHLSPKVAAGIIARPARFLEVIQGGGK